MTCAACAARVEKKLNAIDSVSATVNFATERATVTAPASVAGLRRLGLRTVLLTGDSQATAQAVAAEADTDEVIAGHCLAIRLT